MAGFDDWYLALSRDGGRSFAAALAAALGAGEYIGQQSFASASELLWLARRAGIRPDHVVLDVCCGPGGPGRWLARRLGRAVVGLDRSLAGLRLGARSSLATGRFRAVVGDATRLPVASSAVDAVFLLESMAAVAARDALLAEAARVLRPGGRLACTVELGRPEQVRPRFDPADEVHVTDPAALSALLADSGFVEVARADWTAAHARVAAQLARELADRWSALARESGARLVSDLLASIVAWAELLGDGRVRKVALVAERAL